MLRSLIYRRFGPNLFRDLFTGDYIYLSPSNGRMGRVYSNINAFEFRLNVLPLVATNFIGVYRVHYLKMYVIRGGKMKVIRCRALDFKRNMENKT